jgi:predicted esterase
MTGPHGGAAVATAGLPLEQARAAGILIHGRGASAQGILDLSRAVGVQGVAWHAPQAGGFSWYPYGFMAPMEANQPHLDSALELVGALVDRICDSGMEGERIVLGGFSQGACLSLEWAARNPGRVGAVVALSGGLIGPEGRAWDYEGAFPDTPIFLGCSDVDAHIPAERVHESARVLSDMGARVDKRIYPGMGHTVNEDEIEAFRGIVQAVVQADEEG